ncbi:hypothetical protein [Microbacterium aureliae]
MKVYSDYADHRTRQIIVDVIALAAIAAWTTLGIVIYGLVINLASFGVQMEDAGAGFERTMTDISGTLGDVPLIGDGIRAPFESAAGAGADLEAAGQAQQDAVQRLALGLGVGIAALPTLTILAFWLIPRIRFIRRAGSMKTLLRQSSSVDLLALRALSRQSLADLARLHPDPAGAWRRQEMTVIHSLAALELRSSGVRLESSARHDMPQ